MLLSPVLDAAAVMMRVEALSSIYLSTLHWWVNNESMHWGSHVLGESRDSLGCCMIRCAWKAFSLHQHIAAEMCRFSNAEASRMTSCDRPLLRSVAAPAAGDLPWMWYHSTTPYRYVHLTLTLEQLNWAQLANGMHRWSSSCQLIVW